MDKDDAFLKELQVNDKVKVTVNFFGQEMPFEGTCTGITDDKLSILTSAKPEPVEFPFSAIIERTIISKNKINIEESSEDNTYENIEIQHPDVVYGYYIIDLDNETSSNDFANVNSELNLSYIPLTILLSMREFSTDTIFSKLFNDNAEDLNNIKTFDSFYEENKNQNKETNELLDEYINSLDIFINKDEAHNKILQRFLKVYLSNIASLDDCFYFFYELDKKYQLMYSNDALHTIIYIFHIITFYIFSEDHSSNPNKKQNMIEFVNSLFRNQLILKLIFKQSFSKFIKNHKIKTDIDIFIKFIILYLPMFDLSYFYENNNQNDFTILVDNWYNQQVHTHNLFNPECFSIKCDLENNLKKPALIPLISVNNSLLKSTKYTLIYLLYSLYTSNGRLLYIKITNNELHQSLTNYIKTKYTLDNDLNLTIKTIFSQFTKIVDLFFLNILKICSALIDIGIYDKNHRDLYSIINTNTNSIIQLLDNEANKYIIITTEYSNRLKLFFKRISAISSPVHKLNFSKAEDQLLLSYQNCLEFIKKSNKEIFSDTIEVYLDLVNYASHNKKITSDFYSKFVTVVNIYLIKEAISFNTDLKRIFIPLEITSSKYGQTSYIIRICSKSSLTDKINTDTQTNVKLLPDGHIFHLAEISYTDFDSVIKNGFDITITLQYKLKTAWDFDKCEAIWETLEVSESFRIQDELNHHAEFHEIRNLFRDYSSGSVIKDDRMFFGRDQDIKHVIENIRDEAGRIITNRCVCIYGQTRTGKSSLLYHIKKRLRLSPSNIIVDIGDIGSAGASEAGIKYRILSSLLEEIELEHEDICTILTDSGIGMTADPERNKNDDSYFTEQIGKIRSILKRKAKDTQIIILIDEFTYVYDWIKEKKLSENFMKFWKAFITNYDICAIIVGQDHMMKFINDQRFTNAFGAIRTWEVNYLKEPDACKLVTMPVSDSPDYAGQNGCTILPEAVNMLVEMTSGSAYLLMNICADFIDYLNERHALTATGGHAEDFLRRNLSKFEERWFEPLFNDKSDLDSDASITANKELLKKLALSYSEHSGVLLDELSLTDKEKERLQSLEDRRVVEMKDGRWRITVRLYAEWLRNKFGSR